MFLGVFTHVETDERDAQFVGQYLGYFGLTDSSRSYKQQAGQWLVVVQQAGFGQLYRFYYLCHRFVLSVNLASDAFLQRL